MKNKTTTKFVERDVVTMAFANRAPEPQYTQEEIELHKALGIRANLITTHGAGYAIKWFASWQEMQKK